MKHACLLFALTLLALSGPPVHAADVTAMTFNIRFGTASDGENAWEHRRDFLVDTIREAGPDLIGTQECLDFQADYIVEKLPEYGAVALGREADGGGEMTAVLYRKSAMVPIETAHYWLSETPGLPGSKSWDSSLPRIVTRVKFFHVAGGRPFVVYNTHFDHRGEIARQESARLLLQLMATETLPVIVLGDFNALAPDSEPWRILAAGGLRDAWQIADMTTGPANTWNGFKQPKPDDERRIDWIMVSEGVQVAHCTTIDQARDGRFPSDHFPVVARLSLP